MHLGWWGAAMAIWWKRLSTRGDLVDNEATQLIQAHGDVASEVARKAARLARNRRDLRQARHYSHVALRISELIKPKVVVDAAAHASEHLSSNESLV
jgi:hypothetical protein